jgi:hypothetical protein
VSLSMLLNRPCTITRRSASSTQIDASGDAVISTSTVTTVCELQQSPRHADAEPANEGELSDTQWLLVLPAGTVIDTGDKVTVDGQAFEMYGAPWPARNPRTGVASHVECTVRRTAGAGDIA